eukprot:2483009-Amphidinium_carterae.1
MAQHESTHVNCQKQVNKVLSTSMFPVSGAEQFMAKFAMGFIPSSSAMGAYSSTWAEECHGGSTRECHHSSILGGTCNPITAL